MNASNIGHHVVLGMAGHIDHGKTSLVTSLTGTNTDRLVEEIERGMTTDLGFAFLGNDITIIDVPGHEKFVKTMVAGVNTVDLALLVIAADDGIMPQTREHLEILNLLHIQAGLVAVTKIDIVEPEWLEMVIDDIKRFIKGSALDNAPVIPVSNLTKSGIDTLQNEIFRVAKGVHSRRDKGIFRLLVDRAFSIKGFGTVVAGTVLSGRVSPEDTVELLPQGLQLRVKNVQVHEKQVTEARIGFRTALNLGRVEKESIERGNVVAEPGFFVPTYMIDAHFVLLSNPDNILKNRTRIRVHIGTSEVIARIVLLDKKEYGPGEEGFVQIHFEKPVVADIGDRYVVRTYSPVKTIGGGIILETHPKSHKQFQEEVIGHLQRLYKGDPNLMVLEYLDRERFVPKSEEDVAKGLGITQDEATRRLAELETEGSILRVNKKKFLKATNLESLKKKIAAEIQSFHEESPLQLGLPAAKVIVLMKQPVDRLLFYDVLNDMKQNNILASEGGDIIRLASHSINLSPKLLEYKQQIEKMFLSNPFDPPKMEAIFDEFGDKVKKLMAYLIESGEIVMIEKDFYFHKNAIEEAKKKITEFLTINKTAQLSDLRSALGGEITRSRLVPILEYLDRTGVTKRDGDSRRLK